METRPRNPHEIDIASSDDLLYWSNQFRIGTQDLVDAVQQVGPKVEDIRRHLLQTRQPPNA
jgi:hypothetical protein